MLEFLLALLLGLAVLYLGAVLPTSWPPKPEPIVPRTIRSVSLRELMEKIAREQQHAAA